MARKFHLDLLVTSAISAAYKSSAAELSALVGANIGNMVFRHALGSLIKDFSEYVPVDYPTIRAHSKTEEIDSVIVSCANWLGTREQDEKSNAVRANILEDIEAPITCFGLGVQAPAGAKSVSLGPESVRLAQVIAAKGSDVSVRDQLTKDVLESEGIDNVVVTGCPSNFINPDPELGALIAARASENAASRRKWSDLRTCVTEFSGGHEESGAVLGAHLELLNKAPAFYVLQSPNLLPFLLRENAEIPAAYLHNGPYGRDGMETLLRSKVLHFTSVDSWMDFSRTCDLALGMRIHGNMVPIQSGVPGLVVGHDSRTQGLAGEMGIPLISPRDYLAAHENGPWILFDRIANAMDHYDSWRRTLARRMEGFLRASKLPASEGLSRLSEYVE